MVCSIWGQVSEAGPYGDLASVPVGLGIGGIVRRDGVSRPLWPPPRHRTPATIVHSTLTIPLMGGLDDKLANYVLP